MKQYNSGCMPNTDFRYEEFEGLLGSFYLSLAPLGKSPKKKDQTDYTKAMGILEGFATRYNVQSPQDAVKNPRSAADWGKASEMSNGSALDLMSSFWRDFGVGADPRTEDGRERFELARLILDVFSRYNIAEVSYEKDDGRKVPVKLQRWNFQRSNKTLADVMKE